jgi:DNA helicase-2/ATP-dependent DNA helicase PcrA
MHTKVVGSPGTGKTTYLTGFIKNELKTAQPESMCAVTFTRSASRELIHRITNATNLDRNAFPYFGTLHSICYHMLGIQRNNIVTQEHIQDFCNMHRLEYSQKQLDEDAYIMSDIVDNQSPIGNIMFNIFEWSVTNYPPSPVEHMHEAPAYMFLPLETISPEDLAYYYNEWIKYKQKNDLYDFTDLLLCTLQRNLMPDIDYLIVDEFQDFSKLQYNVYKMWRYKAKTVIIAGDDAQCIYTYAGANPVYFIKEPTDKLVILKYSYRLCKQILDYSQYVYSMMKNQIRRKIEPAGGTGAVEYAEYPTEQYLVDELSKINNTTSVFVLARANYMVQSIAEMLLRNGITFGIIRNPSPCTTKLKRSINALITLKRKNNMQPDECKALFSYLPAKGLIKHGMKKRVEDLNEPLTYPEVMYMFERKLPPEELLNYMQISENRKLLAKKRLLDNAYCQDTEHIHIGTIHASKGLEADVVFLCDDITRTIARNLRENMESELRVFYVGITRAKYRLVILHKFFGKYSFDEIKPPTTMLLTNYSAGKFV